MSKAKHIANINSRKNQEIRTQKVFNRLMIAFIQSFGDLEVESQEMKELMTKYENEWIEYCTNNSHFIADHGKKILRVEMDKALAKLPPIKLKMPPEDAAPMVISKSESENEIQN